MQLKYSRFINVHGHPKCNIPCNLYMEHLNGIVKSCMQHLGANKTERSIQRIGKCIGQIDEILTCYDQQNELPIPFVLHSIPSSNSDRDLMIRELLETDVFSVKPSCQQKFC